MIEGLQGYWRTALEAVSWTIENSRGSAALSRAGGGIWQYASSSERPTTQLKIGKYELTFLQQQQQQQFL